MQYADIAIKTKTGAKDLFTYKIPAEKLPYIKPGSIVEVDFANRKLPGVVIKLRKKLTNVKKYQLKPINKIIEPTPLLDKKRIDLALHLKNYYLTSLGKTIFSLLPKIARTLSDDEPIKLDFDYLKPKKPALVSGDKNYRLKKYLKLIKKANKKNLKTILLTSNINSWLADKIQAHTKATTFDSNLKTKEQYQIWKQGQQGKIETIIGTRQALAVPLPILGLIIIDDINNDLYKNEQEPFIDYRQAALKLSRLTGAQLIYGGLSPTINIYQQAKDRGWQTIKERKNRPNLTVINLKKERGLISNRLKNEVDNLKDKEKALFFLNRLGFNRLAICSHCQRSFYQKPGSKISRCPNCQSSDLKYEVAGVKKIAQLAQEFFEDKKIKVLSAKNSKQDLKTIKKQNYNILIATTKVFDYNLKFDLISLILPEIITRLPIYNSQAKAFYQLTKVFSLAKNSQSQIIYQTFSPSKRLISEANRGDYQSFFDRQLKQRKEQGQPPFKTLLKVYSRKKDDKKLNNLRKKLKKINNLTISPIIKPSFFKWPYFLIRSKKISPKLSKILKSSSLKVDRDPKNLA